MPTEVTHRLLLFFESTDDAQELINHLRNSGCPALAHHLHSTDELDANLLAENWDLLICQHSQDTEACMQLIDASASEGIPSLLLNDHCTQVREKAFAAGARDVIETGDTVHFLHAARREIANRRNSMETASIRHAHQELQARYELLMGGSQDAIAYLTDGMHVDANEAYAARFGYGDCDELACMPVIDLIADQEQDRFKRFLRNYRANDQQEVELDTVIRDQHGTEKNVCMQFAPANYEGEACTQVIIPAQPLATTSGGYSFIADATRQLNGAVSDATSPSLCYLHLENLAEIRQLAGLSASDKAMTQLLAFVNSQCPSELLVGQISQDGLGLLHPSADAASSLPFIEECLSAIGQHIIDVDGRSLRCECCATLIDIPGGDDAITRAIDLAHRATIEALEQEQSRFALVYSPPATPIDLHAQDIDLDGLLRDGRVALYYQPIVSLRGEPGEYYEMSCVVQQTGDTPLDIDSLATQLQDKNNESVFDRWLLMHATRQLLEKRQHNAETRLLVNVSASCLLDQGLSDWLKGALKAANLPPSALTLQLHQRHASNAVKQSQRLFEELSSMGSGGSISELGPENDSPVLLKHVPVRMLKFSNDLVSKAQSDAKYRTQLQELIQQAAESGAATIVPNVGSASVLATLWQLGASFIQGDYLQQPSTAMEYEFAEIA